MILLTFKLNLFALTYHQAQVSELKQRVSEHILQLIEKLYECVSNVTLSSGKKVPLA